MKIIVCGAGSVGRSIVSYLVKGNNDIVVIDDNQRYLDEISKEFDVLPVLGMPSHPDILERADASRADLLLAVTDTDEVNMVICQIAHSLFNVPHKIARIDSEDFLDRSFRSFGRWSFTFGKPGGLGQKISRKTI